MNRLDTMLERLPPLYAVEGESLLHKVMAIFAGWMECFDQDMERVRLSHWIDTATDRSDIEKIGALFDIRPAPWEDDELYRSRIKATIAAMLKGAVTRDTLEELIVSLCEGARRAMGIRFFDLNATGRIFRDPPASTQTDPLFIEYIPQTKRSDTLIAGKGLLKPLEKITLINQSLFRTPLQIIIRGVTGGKTCSPVLVNLTNGNTLVYLNDLPCGKDLYYEVNEPDSLRASVDEVDQTTNVVSISRYEPGASFTPDNGVDAPAPIWLEPGENTIWFFPLAMYDKKSLSSGVAGMPDPGVVHGKFASQQDNAIPGTPLGSSLFEQDVAVSLDCFWVERVPASFRFEVPVGVVQRKGGGQHTAYVEKQKLLIGLLNETVSGLRAAGVHGTVCGRPLRTTQHLRERCTVWRGETGATVQWMQSRLRSISGMFDMGSLDKSSFT